MIYVVAFALIALDFVTGVVKGAATGTLSSTVMREGLYKKASLILLMVLGCLADYAQGFIDLGISVPATAAVCSYIGVMEITSALENICEINPDIMPDKLTALFGSTLTTGSTGEQVAVSDVVAAIVEAVSSTTQEATEQGEEDTTEAAISEAITDEDATDETESTTDEAE